jgi:hypothetical protein
MSSGRCEPGTSRFEVPLGFACVYQFTMVRPLRQEARRMEIAQRLQSPPRLWRFGVTNIRTLPGSGSAAARVAPEVPTTEALWANR